MLRWGRRQTYSFPPLILEKPFKIQRSDFLNYHFIFERCEVMGKEKFQRGQFD